MAKYISVDDLRAATTKHNKIWNTITDASGRGLDEIIDSLQSVEAEPVRHGRWETDGMPMDDGEYLMTRCTVCGTAYEYGHNENYCGYCGALMNEVAQ